MRSRSIVYVAFVALVVACSGEHPTQSGDNGTTPAPKKAKNKVDVCHIDEEGTYRLLSVPEKALTSHLGHGDELAGGNLLDENCEPVFQTEITVTLPGGATMDFVWIEPGTFTMGAEGYYSRESPEHEVILTEGFYMGVYEITQGQWSSVMNDAPWSGQILTGSHPEYPATYISWNDVQAFIDELNGGQELYRLPTEAEWEYACRAGTQTPWYFGETAADIGLHAWYRLNTWDAGIRRAQAVGLLDENPWGLHDVHGNVQEWVQDYWIAGYLSGVQTNPTGPITGTTRVIRGGDFANLANDVRSAFRSHALPHERAPVIGARIVRIE